MYKQKELFSTDVVDEEKQVVIYQILSFNDTKYLEVGVNAGGTIISVLDKLRSYRKNGFAVGTDLFEDIVLESKNKVGGCNDFTLQTHRFGIHPDGHDLGINTVYKEVLDNKLKEMGFNNFSLYKGYNHDIIPTLDMLFDVIFIDSNHTYKACKEDYNLCLPKSHVDTVFIFHNAGKAETLECYKDGGPYLVCEELKQDKSLEYMGHFTERMACFKKIV
jgi:hypothetical protein